MRSSDGLYTYQGSDLPTTGVSDGRPSVNLLEDNTVSNTEGGVKLKYSDNIVLTGESRVEVASSRYFFALLFVDVTLGVFLFLGLLLCLFWLSSTFFCLWSGRNGFFLFGYDERHCTPPEVALS